MNLAPLGDQAVLVYLPDEDAAVAFAAAVRGANPAWLLDVVPAYASVGVFFDPGLVGLGEVIEWLKVQRFCEASLTASSPHHLTTSPPRVIPVCYELGPDLDRVAAHTLLTTDAVVTFHTSNVYTVYAVGFCPGFPYLGYLPAQLAGVPRLPSPRLRVEPGSVGLTGRQTGIYPLARPGGWNLVGRTPLTLVDVADGYFPLRVGDRVQFTRIDEAEFQRLAGERL
jgi:inhibitor of KinA